MKPCTKCKQVKPLTEFHRKPTAGDGCTSKCKGCRNAESLAWHAKNRDKHLAANKEWYDANADRCKQRTSNWRSENKAAHEAYLKTWRAENAAHVRASDGARLRVWKRENPGAVNADTRKRYAAKTRSVPPWCDSAAVKGVYREAQRLRENGFDCHVDHIVPLRGKTVSGLHVPANLAIIHKDQNMKKGNRTWPDQP